MSSPATSSSSLSIVASDQLVASHSAFVDIRALSLCAQCGVELDPDKPVRVAIISINPDTHTRADVKATSFSNDKTNTEIATRATVALVHATCCDRFMKKQFREMIEDTDATFETLAYNMVPVSNLYYSQEAVNAIRSVCANTLKAGCVVKFAQISTGSSHAGALGYALTLTQDTFSKLDHNSSVSAYQIISFDISTVVKDYDGLIAFTPASIINFLISKMNFSKYQNPPDLYFTTSVPLREWPTLMDESSPIRCHLVVWSANTYSQQFESASRQLSSYITSLRTPVSFDSGKWSLYILNQSASHVFRSVTSYDSSEGQNLLMTLRVNCSKGEEVAVFFDAGMVKSALEGEPALAKFGSLDHEPTLRPTERGPFSVAVVKAPTQLVTTHMGSSRPSFDNIIARFSPHFMSVRVAVPKATTSQ